MKRTAAETRRYIEDLEAEIKMLREREADVVAGYAAEWYAAVDFVPPRLWYAGKPPHTPRDTFEHALLDIAEYWWDAHAVTAVYDLCERCGVRPTSRSPSDIEEAADSILLKYSVGEFVAE